MTSSGKSRTTGCTSAEYDRPVSLRSHRSWIPARKSCWSRIIGDRDVRPIWSSTSASIDASVPSTISSSTGSTSVTPARPVPVVAVRSYAAWLRPVRTGGQPNRVGRRLLVVRAAEEMRTGDGDGTHDPQPAALVGRAPRGGDEPGGDPWDPRPERWWGRQDDDSRGGAAGVHPERSRSIVPQPADDHGSIGPRGARPARRPGHRGDG